MKTLEALFLFWNSHGTKALGTMASFVAGIQAAMLVMDDVFTKREVAIVSGLNVALGVWTVKRGFSNSANQQQPE